jgi:hypothetical protein
MNNNNKTKNISTDRFFELLTDKKQGRCIVGNKISFWVVCTFGWSGFVVRRPSKSESLETHRRDEYDYDTSIPPQA